MIRPPSPWLAGAFVVALLAVGIPFWRVPYADVSLPGTMVSPALAVVVFAAAVVRGAGRHGLLATMLVVALAAPVAVMARVVVETAADPTSHNLWPFEVVLAWVVGLCAALAGALLGSIPARLARGR